MQLATVGKRFRLGRMQRAVCPIAALVIALLMVWAGGAQAGPVQEMRAPADGAAQTPAALPPLTAAPLSQAIAPGLLPQSISSGAESATSTALAAELMSEAGASIHLSEALRHAKTAVPGKAADGSLGGALNLREAGKVAMLWAKQTFPWLNSDEEIEPAAQALMPHSADWLASRLEARAAEANLRVDPALLPSAATRDWTSKAGYGKALSRTVIDPDENFVRVTVDFIRAVVEHPMTWLVLSLVVVGGVVTKKIDRRPTK